MRAEPLLALLLVAGLTGCRIQDFEVRSVGIQGLDGLGQEQATVNVALGIHNPNPYRVLVLEDDMGLWFSSDSVGRISFGEGIILPAKQDETVVMTALLDMERVNDVLSRNILSVFIQGLEVKVQGTVTGKAWGARRTIDVDHSERIGLRQGP